jgi:hypothetical protein
MSGSQRQFISDILSDDQSWITRDQTVIRIRVKDAPRLTLSAVDVLFSFSSQV